MSRRQIVYHWDHPSVKVKKLLIAYRNKDKRLSKGIDSRTFIDVVCYLMNKIEKDAGEYELDDLDVEPGEIDYYREKTGLKIFTRQQFLNARESFYYFFSKKNG